MNQKRLCKGHSKMLAGVCSGLAEYMGWDPTVVRIVTALLCLVWGTGLLLYIIAAFVMPEPRDSTALSNRRFFSEELQKIDKLNKANETVCTL